MLREVYQFLQRDGRLAELAKMFELTYQAPVADKVWLKDRRGNSFCLRYFVGGRVAFHEDRHFADEVDAWLAEHGPVRMQVFCEALDLECGAWNDDFVVFLHPDYGFALVHAEGELLVREKWEWDRRDELRNEFLRELGNMYDVPAPLPDLDWSVGDFGAEWGNRFYAHHFGAICEGDECRAGELRSLFEATTREDVLLLCNFITKKGWRELAK